ncbi:MAG TPA: hypothetical protein DCM62_02220 [Bacteroidales bacterium]|nr:hypothetical protein [Bacteroidales bacterium]
MKTTLIFLIAMVAIVTTVSAQRVAALHSPAGVTLFTSGNIFVDAYNAALPGDTIYLSGGDFAAPALFDKRLVVFGAGYHPAHTAATRPTTITNDFNLGDNADNMVLEGVHFRAGFRVANNIPVNNITVRRSRIDGGIHYPGNLATPSVGNTFAECVIIGNSDFANASNLLINNSIIQDRVWNSRWNNFRNSIFMATSTDWGWSLFINASLNVFSNNVVITTHNFIGGEDNSFLNNIFVNAATALGTNPTASGNYLGVPQASIFVSHTGHTFSYASDFNLRTPATHVGNDGTQVGIFGGQSPFKPGGIPQNPHISLRNIAPHTAPDGRLNIQVTVSAQER